MAVPQPRKHWRLRVSVLAALAIVLVWEITSKTVGAYLAAAAPEWELAILPPRSTALLNVADQKLDGEPKADNNVRAVAPEAAVQSPRSGPDAAEGIRKLATAALFRDPVNAHALRILGQLADRPQDDERAFRLMQTSARFSKNESIAVGWLAEKSLQKEDYGAALHYADVLLRTRPQFTPLMMPILVKIAGDSTASADLKKLLAQNPPWRGLFFGALPNSVSDARTPLDLLVALKGSSNPPTANDLRGYLDLLIQHKLYSLAYYAWLQFLPADQLGSLGLLFNGSFETEPSGLPFDWVITPGSGVTIERVPAPDHGDGHALEVSFDLGRVDFRGITQLVVLTPGKYRFDGRYMGSVMGQRGLKWRVACAGGPVIGESANDRGEDGRMARR